jgi:heterodisulfide reductase subunit C
VPEKETNSNSIPVTEATRREYIKEVMKMPGGEKILECIQCGTCSGGCPARFAMDYSPMQIIKMVNLGKKREVLSSSTIWTCSACHTCAARCPREINFSSLAMALRNEAIKQGIADGSINKKFHQSFFNIVLKYGKLYEPELFLNIMDKSDLKGLMSSASLGVRLVRKGKMPLRAPRTQQTSWTKSMLEKTDGGNPK